MDDGAADDGRPHWVKFVFEAGGDPEVSAAAAKGPEEIGLLLLAGPQDLAVGGDELDGPQIIERQAVLAHQPAQPAAEGEPGDARGGDHAAGDRETVQLRLAVELAPGDAALRPHRSALGIDVDALHRRQVDHHPAIDGRAPRHVVAAAANRNLEAEPAGEIDGIHHVGHAAASGDQCRPFVDQSVVDLPRVLVAHVRRLQELSSEGCGKLGGSAGDGCDRRHGVLSSNSACHVFPPGRPRSKREEFS